MDERGFTGSRQSDVLKLYGDRSMLRIRLDFTALIKGCNVIRVSLYEVLIVT